MRARLLPLMKRRVYLGSDDSDNWESHLGETPVDKPVIVVQPLADLPLKHTTTLFALSDHYILSRKWRVIVDLVHINYHGRPMVLKSVRRDRAVDYEGSSL